MSGPPALTTHQGMYLATFLARSVYCYALALMSTSDSILPASSIGEVPLPRKGNSVRGSILSLGSAQLLASRKWSAGAAGVVGHRIGFAVLRRKNVVKRHEVGYRTLVSVTPARWVERFLGNGTSWDQAFAEACAELEVQW